MSCRGKYEFPFQPNYHWSRKYAPTTEIWSYIKKVARDRGLTKFVRFNEEIVAGAVRRRLLANRDR